MPERQPVIEVIEEGGKVLKRRKRFNVAGPTNTIPMRGGYWIALLRVSGPSQSEGLETQRAEIQAWADRGGRKIVSWHSDENVKGDLDSLPHRHGWAHALAAVDEADGIVVYKLDRLARDVVLQEQMLREVWSLGSLVASTIDAENAQLDGNGQSSDRASRQLVRTILGAVADYERQMIRVRCEAGKLRKRELGGFLGGMIPYGFRRDGMGNLIADEFEQAVIGESLTLRALGVTYREIGEFWILSGVRLKRGKKFHAATLKQTLDLAADRGIEPLGLGDIARQFTQHLVR